MSKEPRLAAGSEFDLVRDFRALLPDYNEHVRVGIGDDAAILNAGRIAVSTDMSVEGVHFRRDWMSFDEIGYRSAAVALSDLAAVAARPIGMLVSLALHDDDVPDNAREIMRGIADVCHRYNTSVIGGDVTRSPNLLAVDVTVIGEVTTPVLRSGAHFGDSVWVTGRLGGAAAAVRVAHRGRTPGNDAQDAYIRPAPRIEEAIWLAEQGVLHAMIDISDGLAGDAAHICAASGVAIRIYADTLPIHAAVLRTRGGSREHIKLALTGGDDYELCFTAEPGAIENIEADFYARFDVPLTCIGDVQTGDDLLLTYEGVTKPLGLSGYRHFEQTPL